MMAWAAWERVTMMNRRGRVSINSQENRYKMILIIKVTLGKMVFNNRDKNYQMMNMRILGSVRVVVRRMIIYRWLACRLLISKSQNNRKFDNLKIKYYD